MLPVPGRSHVSHASSLSRRILPGSPPTSEGRGFSVPDVDLYMCTAFSLSPFMRLRIKMQTTVAPVVAGWIQG